MGIIIGCLAAYILFMEARNLYQAKKAKDDGTPVMKSAGLLSLSSLDPIAAFKQLLLTTEKDVLSSTPVRSVCVTLAIHLEKVADALPNAASQVACHGAIKTLITELGDPTLAA